MKGYAEVSIQNRGIYVAYNGEHYVVRNANTGRTTRMAKDEIIRKFHLYHDALDRHIAGGFKRHWCMANEDIVKIARSLNEVESTSFLVTSLIVMITQIIMILAVILGYIDGHVLRPYVAPMVFVSLGAMTGAAMIPEILADKFDFVLGIEREE